MLQLILSYLWHNLFAWVGITGIVLIGAIVVYVKVPVPSVRHLAVSVGSACLCILFLYPKGYLDAKHADKVALQKQEQKLREAGDHARADSVRDAASGMCDPYDLDDGCK